MQRSHLIIFLAIIATYVAIRVALSNASKVLNNRIIQHTSL